MSAREGELVFVDVNGKDFVIGFYDLILPHIKALYRINHDASGTLSEV